MDSGDIRFSMSLMPGKAISDDTSDLLDPRSLLRRRSIFSGLAILSGTLISTLTLSAAFTGYGPAARSRVEPFYSHVSRPEGICIGVDGRRVSSWSGHIGLKSDSDRKPKGSFFWLFEAENDAANAPVVLTFGGGPGTSGMVNPVLGQSHCIVTPNGTVANPNRWTEKFNLLALDHPIGVGFSYGTKVNNSRAAAEDVYDFLQRFLRLFPHLAKNQLVISSGSYGGTYVPHVATVIKERNIALANGHDQASAVHINLESLILSNPISDALSHYRWLLHYRCVEADVYDSTTCRELYSALSACLESIALAYEDLTVESRDAIMHLCYQTLDRGDTHDTLIEDVRPKCNMTEDVASCYPEFDWLRAFFNNPTTKDELGVPSHVGYMSEDVYNDFVAVGDRIHPHHLLYERLFQDGIRLLHYIGARDASCAWPGVLSFLKLFRTPFQQDFIHAADMPWPSEDIATVRSVGKGAGGMTFIKVAEAGHFVRRTLPAGRCPYDDFRV
ncbi:alpha/beta-hydrolase [Artomyces pyxidatus]|uniref:Alpha/beta-hydrolase n=1 Tax=Artomyces pyxidatus TaxID=48021 RepID=A0ACB8SJP5_9AGAM|nr:alpha/beta-hydrolase [Artomyces pyxidatus]